MAVSFVKTAYRGLRLHRGLPLLNIVGLAVGIGACVLIMIWILDEIGFDRFHENASRIYRAYHIETDRNPPSKYASVPAPLAPALAAEYPEIVAATRYKRDIKLLVRRGDRVGFEQGGAFVDPDFLDIFSFKLTGGDPEHLFDNILSVVLTESFARKYFGDENPIGETVAIENKADFLVTGVIEDPPSDSSLQFDFLAPMELLRNAGMDLEAWDTYAEYNAYLLLAEGADPRQLDEKMAGILTEHDPESVYEIALQPLTRIHLYNLNGGGPITNVIIFSVMALLILIIACINFMNMTIARAGDRAKEIGIRKAAGASRIDLVRQFLGESILATLAAFSLALLLVWLLLPLYNDLSGKSLDMAMMRDRRLLLGAAATIFFTAVLSGGYPAFLLSSLKPVASLKSSYRCGTYGGASLLKKILVIGQFTISIMLIVCTLTVADQMRFVRSTDLGFERDQIIYFSMSGSIGAKYEAFKTELLRERGIRGVTTGGCLPNEVNYFAGGLDWEGKPADQRGAMSFVPVDHDYLRTFGIEVIEGRDFSGKVASDAYAAFIVNESAVELMGLRDPVGAAFSQWGRKGTIIGVVRDFHHQSLRTAIEPLFFTILPNLNEYIMIKIEGDAVTETIHRIEQAHANLNPGFPFDYHFLDESIESQYRAEVHLGRIFRYFTFLAIAVSCLGLLGLTAFAAQRRTKEMGIRKVLGASARGIVFLLTREFLVLVLLSAAFALPAAIIAMQRWLSTFVYHTEIGPETLLVSVAAALSAAGATTAWQAIRIATTNPVEVLRDE